ncbi:cell division FtsZ family protein [Candidatus Parcubacteria bacterium]|nr:cell division FtsZ family protein [Candidatus Parcubacteria bacterium]
MKMKKATSKTPTKAAKPIKRKPAVLPLKEKEVAPAVSIGKPTKLIMPKIKTRVVGIGFGGSSMLLELKQRIGGAGASFVALDTDEKTAKRIGRKVKTILFGQQTAQGLGTGMDCELARKAALEDKEKLRKIFQGQDLIIFISALGGGVGSGASPVLAELAKEEKALSLGFFTMPFEFEGEKKMKMAKKAALKLKESLSGVVIAENEKIFQLVDRKTPLKKALAFLDGVFAAWLSEIMDVILKPSLINIDFADLRTILKDRNNEMFLGQAISMAPNRVEEILKQLFSNPIFGGSPKKANRILFNISGGKDLKLKEVEVLSSEIANLNPRAKIIFGVSENQKLAGKIKVVLIAVSSAQQIEEQKMVEKRKSRKLFKIKGKNKKAGQGKAGENGAKNGNGNGKGNGKDEAEQEKRKSGVKAKEDKIEEEEQEWESEATWEVPAFLRKP